MSWLALLNPLNWIKIISLIRSLWDAGVSIYKWFIEQKQKKAQEAVLDQIHDVEKKIDEANTIKDEKERLDKKAEAACELEKTLNPDSDC